MKILIVSPVVGGINIYISTVIRNLRDTKDLEIDFFSTELNQSLYDPTKKTWCSSDVLMKKFNQKVVDVNWDKYDFILLNYGKNDAEQLLPVYLESIGFAFDKLVYFVHYLSWNLFSDYIVDLEMARKVKEVTKKIPNLFFFGTFAKDYWIQNYSKPQNYIIDFLPETHSQEKVNESSINEFFKENNIVLDNSKKIIIWAGYPSNYKNHNLLLNSLTYIKTPINIVFAGRGWGKRIDKVKYSNSKIKVEIIDKELNSKEYLVCSLISEIGIFLYQQPANSNEIFQGSGTLPNYLYAGKPCIVLDEGAMTEYVQEAGLILKEKTAIELANKIDAILSESKKYSNLAFARKSFFDQRLHSNRIYNFLSYLNK